MTLDPAHPLIDSPAVHDRPYDLRTLLGGVGSAVYATLPSPDGREQSPVLAEMVEDGDPRPVTGTPLAVSAFVDGVQSTRVLAWRQGRPVALSYLAAGAAGPGPALLGVHERLMITCSSSDLDWVGTVNSGDPAVPVHVLTSTTPPSVAADTAAMLSTLRDELERNLVSGLLDAGADILALDGSLSSRPVDERLVGVVKTTRTRYLPDESWLWSLPAGWRTPIFRIAAHGPCRTDRYSCYVRLHDASRAGWDFALIRLEAFTPDLLEALAARTLAERQLPGSSDPRWDRHLQSVAVCEQLLRDRRPMVLS